MPGLLDGKFINDNSLGKAKLSPSPASSNSEYATLGQVIALQQGFDFKNNVMVAMGNNVSVTAPGSSFDGITLTNSGVDDLLLYGQATASQNGIYIWNGAGNPLTRRADSTPGNLTSGAKVYISIGSTNAGKTFVLRTADPITVNTTSLSFSPEPSAVGTQPTTNNKNMQCSVTANDGDVACTTGITGTPIGSVRVYAGGIIGKLEITFGNGTKVGVVGYFSADGTAARAYNAIQSGDKFYWNQSVAGFNLATTDYISFDFNV